jgi:hypothetical protein
LNGQESKKGRKKERKKGRKKERKKESFFLLGFLTLEDGTDIYPPIFGEESISEGQLPRCVLAIRCAGNSRAAVVSTLVVSSVIGKV